MFTIHYSLFAVCNSFHTLCSAFFDHYQFKFLFSNCVHTIVRSLFIGCNANCNTKEKCKTIQKYATISNFIDIQPMWSIFSCLDRRCAKEQKGNKQRELLSHFFFITCSKFECSCIASFCNKQNELQ